MSEVYSLIKAFWGLWEGVEGFCLNQGIRGCFMGCLRGCRGFYGMLRVLWLYGFGIWGSWGLGLRFGGLGFRDLHMNKV